MTKTVERGMGSANVVVLDMTRWRKENEKVRADQKDADVCTYLRVCQYVVLFVSVSSTRKQNQRTLHSRVLLKVTRVTTNELFFEFAHAKKFPGVTYTSILTLIFS